MGTITRREFLHDSAALAAALAGSGLVGGALSAAEEAKKPKKAAANDRLHVAVIGVRGQGMSHIRGFAGENDCVVSTVCDVDEAVIGNAMRHVEKVQGKAPKYEKDLRRVLEDKAIDLVTIATPNHWHALAAIWAIQAGKDV